MPEEMTGQNEQVEATRDPNKGMSMLDFVKANVGGEGQTKPNSEVETAAAATNVEETPTAEEVVPKEETIGESGALGKPNEEKKEGEETEQKPEEATEGTPPSEEGAKAPVPYERFEEVNTKFRDTEAELNRLRPQVQEYDQFRDYMSKNGITVDQVNQLMEIQALLNSDPQAALKKILPIVEAVQGFVGDRLPPDLQAKVDKGALDPNDAREIASLRAKTQFGGARYDQYVKMQQEQAQRNFTASLQSTAKEWTETKLKSNPDFKPKAKESDPDGLYEVVGMKFATMLQARGEGGQPIHPVNKPSDIAVLLQKAYDETLRWHKPLKAPPTKKPLTQTGSGRPSAKTIEEAGSIKEAIQISLAERGIAFR